MVLVEKFEVHDTLNPKLWDNSELRVDVRDKLLEITQQFISSCDIPLHLVDVHIVGSQASYNYTDASDLDLHLISNFELIDCSKEVLQAAFNSIKTRFNSEYNIQIKGIDVEVYVEDVTSGVNSNGIYSVLNNKWIKKPVMLTDIKTPNITKQLQVWTDMINKVLSANNAESIEKTIDELYMVRKNGLAISGEYGAGNTLFKEIRNIGLLDALKDAYKKTRSKELSLESVQRLTEDSRGKLLSKSKQTDKGFQRFKRRVKSRVANSVKQYNAIDMNKLFKDDILTVDVNVKGETDNYTVKISFGGLLELIREQIEKIGKLDYKAVTRALIIGFNKDDVYISCSCPDWQYRFAYFATRNEITSGDPELRPSDITNPDDNLGSACKHVLLVLSNTSFLLKVSSVIYNYINYMEKHYQKLYADIIYPAIYGKDYEEPVQLDMFDDNTLETDTDTIDKSNQYAVDKTRFQKGNTQGVRFAPKTTEEPTLLDDNTQEIE